MRHCCSHPVRCLLVVVATSLAFGCGEEGGGDPSEGGAGDTGPALDADAGPSPDGCRDLGGEVEADAGPDGGGAGAEDGGGSGSDAGPRDGAAEEDGAVDGGELRRRPRWRDLPYHEAEGWAQGLTSLDLYSLDDGQPRDLAVYVHGGGWTGGDKVEVADSPALVDFFLQRGFLLASINYRLFDSAEAPGTTYRDQATDVARALRWLSEHAPEYGGRGEGLTLVGSEAGAHLATLVVADPRYLTGEGAEMGLVRACVALDGLDFHVGTGLALREGGPLEAQIPLLERLFGARPAQQLAASPAGYLDEGTLPPVLLLSTGQGEGGLGGLRNRAGADFKRRLLEAGHDGKHHHLPHLSAGALQSSFGAPEQGTPVVVGALLDRVAQPPRRAPLTPALADSIARAVRAHVDPTGADPARPTAIVVGVVRGEAEAMYSFGRTAAGDGAPVSPHHLFAIGSVTKALTGLALAHAEERGLLSAADRARDRVDDPLGALLDERITLAHLVSHTGGFDKMPDNLHAQRDVDGDGQPDSTPDSPARHYGREHLRACFERGGCELLSEPGLVYHYSNLGLGLLGLALVDGTGAHGYDHLHRRALTWGLEMDDTGILSDAVHARAEGRRVTGHMPQGGGGEGPPAVTEVGYPDMGELTGAGGVISTGADLTALLRTLAQPAGHPLQAVVERATAPLHVVEDGRSVAYAIDVSEAADGTRTYSKGGVTAGYTSFVIWRPSVRAGVVVLTNRGRYQPASELGWELLEQVAATDDPVPWGRGARAIGGRAYFFDMDPPPQIRQIHDVVGAEVYVVEAPELRAVVSPDDEHAFRLEGIPEGASVTLALVHEGYYPTMTATFRVGAQDLEGVTFQAMTTNIAGLAAGLLGVDVSDDSLCQMATTVSAANPPDIWAVGEPDATVTVQPAVPAEQGPYYFNAQVIPEPELEATTTDGGVIVVGAQPGLYRWEGHKDGVTFEPIELRCVGGWLTNASPPWGLNVVGGGE